MRQVRSVVGDHVILVDVASIAIGASQGGGQRVGDVHHHQAPAEEACPDRIDVGSFLVRVDGMAVAETGIMPILREDHRWVGYVPQAREVEDLQPMASRLAPHVTPVAAHIHIAPQGTDAIVAG